MAILASDAPSKCIQKMTSNVVRGRAAIMPPNLSLRLAISVISTMKPAVKKSLDKIKEDEIEPDFVSALKLCKRRRIGPLRPEANRELFYKKDMGILARGGFSFDLSKRVLDLDTEEFYKLIKII